MARQRTIPLSVIRDECDRLRSHLVAAGGASREELRLVEPGERDNPDSGPDGVLKWYGYLMQRMAVPVSAPAQDTAADDAANVAGLRALAAQPKQVRLVGDLSKAVLVHPKGLSALTWCDEADQLMGRLTLFRDRIATSVAEDDRALLERADAELMRLLGLFVWAVTSPGAGLPWGDAPAIAPDWIADIDPIDVMQIAKAHQEVNGKRLQALSRLLSPPEPGAQRAQLMSVFVAGVAKQQGVRASEMMEDWTLAEVMATYLLAGEGEREAHEAAKKKADRDRLMRTGSVMH